MLHDLKNDPDQLQNLAGDPAHESILLKMRDRTNAYIARYTRPEIEALRKRKR